MLIYIYIINMCIYMHLHKCAYVSMYNIYEYALCHRRTGNASGKRYKQRVM